MSSGIKELDFTDSFSQDQFEDLNDIIDLGENTHHPEEYEPIDESIITCFYCNNEMTEIDLAINEGDCPGCGEGIG